MARLLSVNVGLPREIEWRGRPVRTAIRKNPVRGRCQACQLNPDGDGQGDLAGLRGEHRCEIGLVCGAVVYEPEPLDNPGDSNLLVCCSRPTGDVVIDL